MPKATPIKRKQNFFSPHSCIMLITSEQLESFLNFQRKAPSSRVFLSLTHLCWCQFLTGFFFFSLQENALPTYLSLWPDLFEAVLWKTTWFGIDLPLPSSPSLTLHTSEPEMSLHKAEGADGAEEAHMVRTTHQLTRWSLTLALSSTCQFFIE